MFDFITRRFVTVCLLTLTLLVGSCGVVSIAYQQLDNLALWWIKRYTNLDETQTELVKLKLKAWLEWHRTQQLPEYVKWLQSIDERIKSDAPNSEFQAITDGIKQRMQISVLRIVPDMAELAVTLKPQQIRFLAKKFEESNADFNEEYLNYSPEKQRKRRAEKIIERTEYWLGSLDKNQRTEIYRLSDTRNLEHELWLEERISRQKEFLNVLESVQTEGANKEKASVLLKNYFSQQTYSRNNEREQYFVALEKQSVDMTSRIWAIATPGQEAHAHKKLQGWIIEFKKLSSAS